MDDLAIYLLLLLIIYLFGMFSPSIFKRLILPRLADWLQDKLERWKPKKPSNPISSRGRPKGSKNKPKEAKK